MPNDTFCIIDALSSASLFPLVAGGGGGPPRRCPRGPALLSFGPAPLELREPQPQVYACCPEQGTLRYLGGLSSDRQERTRRGLGKGRAGLRATHDRPGQVPRLHAGGSPLPS